MIDEWKIDVMFLSGSFGPSHTILLQRVWCWNVTKKEVYARTGDEHDKHKMTTNNKHWQVTTYMMNGGDNSKCRRTTAGFWWCYCCCCCLFGNEPGEEAQHLCSHTSMARMSMIWIVHRTKDIFLLVAIDFINNFNETEIVIRRMCWCCKRKQINMNVD